MWIVRLALRRPYTVAVAAALIFLMGCLSLFRMLVDIFPVIDIPVVGVVWSYAGLSAEEMESRVVFITERALSTTVSGISRIESESIPGIGLLRVYFERGSDIGGAIAEINAVTTSIVKILPPGMTPPAVVRFNASNVPVAQLVVASDTLPEEQLFDYALNFIRVRLFTIPGLATPAPYGGRQRQINIDVDPAALYARGLSANDVVNALGAQNLILPAGVARVGDYEISVASNASPTSLDAFRRMPIRYLPSGALVTIGDVAAVRDAYADQTNLVRINGKRATYLNILKKANASTLAVVKGARDAIPDILKTAPKGLTARLEFDQSTFVHAAIVSVVREGLIAAALVSLMILLFLGSWRSVVIVCTSIPLAILCSIIGLNLTGDSINIMTLGGLALAIGMLVDDATVAIEATHRQLEGGTKTLAAAVVGAAHQIALPAITATAAICIVFFPVVLLTGAARYLFTPMALAVVLAMIASYVLSRTLVPLLAYLMMGPELERERQRHGGAAPAAGPERGGEAAVAAPPAGPERGGEAAVAAPRGGRWAALLRRVGRWRAEGFARLERGYEGALAGALAHPRFTLAGFAFLVAVTAFLPFTIGLDFFPAVDAGMMRFHFRAPPGTRLEATEQVVAQVEEHIRRLVPAAELATINSDIGVPTSYNLAFVPTENTASMDAEILVSLKPKHAATIGYVRKLRRDLAASFPGCEVAFQPADIVSQVLSFGSPAPIDVEVQDRNLDEAFALAQRLRAKIAEIPGAADVNLRQVMDYPQVRLRVDRDAAAKIGLTEKDAATNMLVSLTSSSQTSPSFFIDPKTSVNYQVSVKAPLPAIRSLADVLALPVSGGGRAETVSNLGQFTTETTMNEVSHATVQRMVEVLANVDGRDLGGVTSDIKGAIRSLGALPAGAKILVTGQNEVMTESFTKLGLGLILAAVLVYLLMAVLFQSWLDPLIVMVAVPGALVGILWMLLLTGTTINVVSLMGSIMAIGIAASNSILVVSYANDLRVERGAEADALSPRDAALRAGRTRLRPVLMTAIAMIIGMAPAALGLGEGGAQNAPLGRAVIGGLIVATGVTLFVVPVAYAALRKKLPVKHLLDARLAAEEAGRPFHPGGLLPEGAH